MKEIIVEKIILLHIINLLKNNKLCQPVINIMCWDYNSIVIKSTNKFNSYYAIRIENAIIHIYLYPVHAHTLPKLDEEIIWSCSLSNPDCFDLLLTKLHSVKLNKKCISWFFCGIYNK